MRLSIRSLLLVTTLAVSASFAQEVPGPAQSAANPLELAREPFHVIVTPDERATVIALLDHARDKYSIDATGVPYDLKASFRVNSGNKIEYDGAWKFEKIHSPQLGSRWTATAEEGYSTTRIDSHGLHVDSSSEYGIPLGLQEATGYALSAMGELKAVTQQQFRISPAVLEGVPLTCVLRSDGHRIPEADGARRWNELEDCIETATGRLRVHSTAPNWYAHFDYTSSSDFLGRELPRRMVLWEAGLCVIQFEVDSVTQVEEPNPNLFKPDNEMVSPEPSVAMAETHRFATAVAPARGDEGCKCKMPPEIHRVLVFGLKNASGRIVDAHSLDPLDSKSDLAVETVSNLPWSPETSSDGRPLQRMVTGGSGVPRAQQCRSLEFILQATVLVPCDARSHEPEVLPTANRIPPHCPRFALW